MFATASEIALAEPFGHLNPAPHLLELHYDRQFSTYRCYLKSDAPKHFTPELLRSLLKVQRELRRLPLVLGSELDQRNMQYHVLGSNIPGVFSLGGDLQRLERLVREGDRVRLQRYGLACLDLILSTIDKSGPPTLTIALVQGRALGGGFEAALACDVLVAERGSELGFPEVLFNMFPGMGAYALLLRRVSPGVAAKIIQSGKSYAAEELNELGVVDVLADSGAGEAEVSAYVRRHRRSSNGLFSFTRSREIHHQTDEKELMEVLEVWVDCALSLREQDLRVMRRLSGLQEAP